MDQLEIVTLDELVDKGHIYRQLKKELNFEDIDKRLSVLRKDNPNEGYGLSRLFKCIFLQYLEDLSDRELERYLKENNAVKWFCGLGLTEKTPGGFQQSSKENRSRNIIENFQRYEATAEKEEIHERSFHIHRRNALVNANNGLEQ